VHPALVGAILAGHRLLLWAYPRRFSAQFADEMAAVFAEALAEATRGGLGPVVRLMARELAQAPGQLLEAHWRERRAGMAASADNGEAQVVFRRPIQSYAVIAVIALILLAPAIWWVRTLGFGLLGTILPVLLAVSLILGALAGRLTPVLRRIGAGVWLGAGLLCLVGLAWPTSALVESGRSGLSPNAAAVRFWLPLVALVVAALLLAAGLTREPARAGGGRGARWTSLACLALSALLAAKTLHNLYWLLVWDLTYDPLTFLWLIPPVAATVFAGVMLATGLAGKARWAGLYGVLVLAGLAAAFTVAERVDFRQLTAARAERVKQAVEAYNAREGRYPQDLSALAPWYGLALPAPVIINGQDWCYQAGDDYYQLGYVERDHWSSPILLGHLHAAQGEPATLQPLCAAEITALQQTAAQASFDGGMPVSGAALVARIQRGSRRADVLRGMDAFWHRDGCPPRRPAGSDYAYTDLFWLGSHDVSQSTVAAVHYRWEAERRTWVVASAEVVANEELYERYSHCSALDLSSLSGKDP
jgi:hypothetical protein